MMAPDRRALVPNVMVFLIKKTALLRVYEQYFHWQYSFFFPFNYTYLRKTIST